MSTINKLQAAIDAAKTEYRSMEKGTEDFTPGSIELSDNAAFLARHSLSKGRKADFIYIDPPFFSGSEYKARIEKDGRVDTPVAYSDRWDDLSGFIENMALRLMLAKDVLSDSGLIAVHVDPRASHYIRLTLDELFGSSRFVNEIVWSYKSGGASTRSFAKKHDTILLYSKTKSYFFNPTKEKSYNRGGKPYRFKGVEEFCDEDGRWYTLVNRKDVLNVDMVGRTSSERTGYATQKPEKLLEILITSCCPEGGLCLDFFCGSGSLGAAAKKLGRDYVLCDSSPLAIEIAKKRLSPDL